MSAACVIGLSVLARITKRAAAGAGPDRQPADPLRAAEAHDIDVISRGRLRWASCAACRRKWIASSTGVSVRPVLEAHDFI
jgi:hypothetical protein